MATSNHEAKDKSYRFWKSKPVIKYGTRPVRSEQILSEENIRSKYGSDECISLPNGYVWSRVEMNDNGLTEVVEFLNTNYREGYVSKIDTDRMRWETCNIGFFVCVREEASQKIVGCIGLTTRTLQINSEERVICEPIYMCTCDDLRRTSLVKVIINESIRQAVNAGYYIGSFCTDQIVPSPVATIRYYTRPLNYKYLKANDFVSIGDIDDDIAHDRIKIKLKPPKTVYIVQGTDDDVKLVHDLYSEYMKSFNLHHVLSLDEVRHYFFDDRYVKTIFYEDESGNVVDFLTYRFYDIVNEIRGYSADHKYGNIIKATNIFAYSSNYHRSDILIINAFKVISGERHHMVYIPDMMGSNDAILSIIKESDEDTLDEEENALFDQHIVKSRKKQFINLFNWSAPLMTQEMVSYLIFN